MRLYRLIYTTLCNAHANRVVLSLQKLLRYPEHLHTYLHTSRNNDNNGDVAYVSLDLTFALIYATGDNILQHGRHLLHTYFNDLRKCARFDPKIK